jgi:hypothetical protein
VAVDVAAERIVEAVDAQLEDARSARHTASAQHQHEQNQKRFHFFPGDWRKIGEKLKAEFTRLTTRRERTERSSTEDEDDGSLDTILHSEKVGEIVFDEMNSKRWSSKHTSRLWRWRCESDTRPLLTEDVDGLAADSHGPGGSRRRAGRRSLFAAPAAQWRWLTPGVAHPSEKRSGGRGGRERWTGGRRKEEGGPMGRKETDPRWPTAAYKGRTKPEIRKKGPITTRRLFFLVLPFCCCC